MIIAFKPQKYDLDAIIAEGTHNGKTPTAKWHENYFSGIAEDLRRDPKMYRNFGPYWWLMKKELAAHGYYFGDNTTPHLVQSYDYGDTSYNIAACHAYYSYVIENCFLYSSDHAIYYHDTESDNTAGEITWEQGVYHLGDVDMDTLDPQ